MNCSAGRFWGKYGSTKIVVPALFLRAKELCSNQCKATVPSGTSTSRKLGIDDLQRADDTEVYGFLTSELRTIHLLLSNMDNYTKADRVPPTHFWSNQALAYFLIDFLHKSGFEAKLKVVNRSDQIETSSKTLTTVSIRLTKDSQDL